jgi:hypothetical protein
MIDELDQFVEEEDIGANVGVGYSGWDDSYEYARTNDLDYFGAVFPLSGDAEEPMAFGNGMWRWSYLVRMHIRYDGKNLQASDNNAMTLANDFMTAMFDTTNRRAVASTGWAKVVASNYISDPLSINDVVYLSMEFVIAVKEQIS